MELEFDKEIDALLRKARSGTPAAASTGKHLDADAIAAFAEAAVPDALRNVYTKHFADCDRCRGLLSQTAVLNEPAAKTAVAAAAAPAHAPWPPNAVPWYRSLFRSPGLAAAMGILVLAFGGVLLYSLITRNAGDANSSVAMAPAAANANSVPYPGIEANATANGAAHTASNATTTANASAPSVAKEPLKTGETGSDTAGRSEGTPGADGGTSTGDVAAGAPRAAAQPPPAPVTGARTEDKPKTDTDNRKDEREKERSRALEEDRLARDATLSKKSAGGPIRGTGPVQTNVQNNAQAFDMPVTRKVGGKAFHNDNGAWYDSAYRGESTTNVSRGTEEFKKLDSGLRSIAKQLGGVVVVVWKEKAYRIQ